MKQNNYLLDKKFGQYKVELVLPSYKAFNSDLGLYWDLGVSLSVGGTNSFDFRVGLIIGWFRIIKYL